MAVACVQSRITIAIAQRVRSRRTFTQRVWELLLIPCTRSPGRLNKPTLGIFSTRSDWFSSNHVECAALRGAERPGEQ